MQAKTRIQSAPARTQMFLRIKHPSMDPEFITQEIEITPEHATCAGEVVTASGVRRLHSETYWLAALPMMGEEIFGSRLGSNASVASLRSPGFSMADARSLVDSTNIHDVAIVAWLRQLEVHRDFFARIAREKGSITLVISRGEQAGPFTLSTTMAQRIAQTHIQLEID